MNNPDRSKYIHIDEVYKLVAGHSIYGGDSILCAFKCLTEGKEVKPIKPLDITYYEVSRLQKQRENKSQPYEDCRNCKKWDECLCGKEGHINGTSIGYSIGECKEYEPCEETRELLTADERALFLNKLTHWLNDNFNDIVIGGWQDTDGEIFDLFFIRRR